MPKFEDNQSVMNANLVNVFLMYILCAMYVSGHLELNLISSYTSFHTARAGNTHSTVSIFNNDHVEINKTF